MSAFGVSTLATAASEGLGWKGRQMATRTIRRMRAAGRIVPRQQPVETGRSPLAAALSVAGTLGPPLTVATSLMLYFGWARSDTQATSMGLDVSLFGFTTQDYVMRSVSTLYIPLLATVSIALGWLALHSRVLAGLGNGIRRGAVRKAGLVGLGTGLGGAVAVLMVASLDRDAAPLVLPLVLAGATQVAAYGGWLLRASSADRNSRVTTSWQGVLRKLLVGSVVTLALFWELSNYAAVVGRGYALDIAGSLATLPRATAYSAQPLGIQAPGVHEERLEAGDGYRTSGLRLLVRSGGRLFLLHDGWSPRSGTVIVLPDNDHLRWQFSR
jgi:hypothetical protein